MGQALYRKYRSKSLAEIVGQEHITDTLKKALASGRISHAYLFTGPRGVGKTSIARILAHEINKLPYEDDRTHLDIIEIDAASNRRIDEIRDLREKVHIAPTSAQYKVYIIDEVHMLTKEAFNALLKTLEEPPQHVIFILATTEIHKLPETIISRTQRYTFKPVVLEQAVAHLRTIAEKEHIDITDEALQLIAEHGDGSFRDSISLLDQVSGQSEKVDLAYVQGLLGIPPETIIEQLHSGLKNHDTTSVMHTIGQLQEQGYQAAQIAKQLGELWRKNLIDSGTADAGDFTLLEKLLQVPGAHNPVRFLEITLLAFALQPAPGSSTTAVPVRIPSPQPKKVTITKSTATELEAPKVEPATAKSESQKVEPLSTPPVEQTISPKTQAVVDAALWPTVLSELKKKYNTLYGIVRMAEPTFSDNGVQLGFSFAFHRKRLMEAKNQQILTEIIQQVSGHAIAITCVDTHKAPGAIEAVADLTPPIVAEESETPPEATTPTTVSPITTINNIFGGGELLES